MAYLIGNISPSIILAKANGIDIKKEGSGNAGTTNALRVMGKKAGVITLVIDVLKGVAAVLLGAFVAGSPAVYWCALAVVCGHVWPAFYRFKGGKGVATVFGAAVGINPVFGFSALGIVIIIVLLTKRMSVGSLTGAVCFPVLAIFMERDFFTVACIMALLIIYNHRANIGRLVKGEEPVMSIFNKQK
ncbi:MAG: glycerol-3-phosphate 1-O-acyltransferase PlsY [Clostridiales bacterium]|nr:glycerol-3-phosphate 1-O-acyltransferase PlsY [Clostridiales bacterium]